MKKYKPNLPLAIVSLFVLTSFLFSFSAEAVGLHDFSQNSEQQITSSYSSVSTSIITGTDCEDCQKSDCGDHQGHCSHHCSGMHNIVSTKNLVSLKIPTGLNNKILWYYNHHYKTPFLDPALKPPAYS